MKKRQRRKGHPAEKRIPFPKSFALFLVCVAGFGIAYVSLCARCDTLGSDIKRLESDCRTSRLRAINEEDRWANLLSPANFERTLKRHQLDMVMPDERQIVRVRRGRIDTLMTLAYNP